jgi:predicted DNA-binding protein
MPREKSSEEQQQISVMLPVNWVERLDVMAEKLSEPGATSTRADVLRMAIRRGLEVLEAAGRPKR